MVSIRPHDTVSRVIKTISSKRILRFIRFHPKKPEDCEATVDLQLEQIQFLKKAYDMLAEPFESLLGPPAELKSGKRRPSPEYYTRPPDWIPFPSLVAHRPDYAPRMMKNTHFPDTSGMSSGQRAAKILEQCSFVLVRSCEEFEGEYIRLIQELYEKPVLSVGVLSPVPKSVVFVGFGSEYKMPVEQIHELAFSLELSRLPFLWILRKPQGVESSDLLPRGFVDRTRSRGVVLLGWAPQLEILARPAIGGCLFHSGWGTIIESLIFGHPLVLLPMLADQGLNAKLLVEKGVGYEVPRNEDGSFNRDVVAESIRRVLVAPEGKHLRLKAAHMQTVFDNHESQDNYINKFIEHLEKHNDIKRKKQV